MIDVRKEYGPRVAVQDLSLSVQPGEVFGFLGPNGAGKTTTVKMLLGLARPTRGTVRIFGRSPAIPSTRRLVGYLPENFRFHDWLTGIGLLELHARLAGMSGTEARERIPEVLRLVGLEGRGQERLRGYSKGMTQRIGLAQAILHRPRVVFLDEPTSALDPVGRRDVRDLIRTLGADGVTVFLNSHLLSEVELVCSRVAIVDRGRVVRAGRLDDLASGVAVLQISLDCVDERARRLLGQYGTVADVEGRTAKLEVGDLGVAPSVAEALVRSGYRLYGLVPVHQSLEEVFVTLVEGGDG